MATAPPLIPWRCPGCNRLLALVRLEGGSTVAIKCGRCQQLCTAVAVQGASV